MADGALIIALIMACSIGIWMKFLNTELGNALPMIRGELDGRTVLNC
jgi:putative sterol carrier protein